jgi:hypothetical protein
MAPVGVLLAPAVGVVMLVLLSLTFGELPRVSRVGPLLAFCVVLGGPPAAVLAPLAWYILMERVSLLRAIAVTSAASVVGGIVVAHVVAAAWSTEAAGVATVPGAVLGCLTGILWLRLRAGHTLERHEHAA